MKTIPYSDSLIRASEERCNVNILPSSTPTEPLGERPARIARPTPADLIKTEGLLEFLWNQGEIPSLLHLAGSADGTYEEWLCSFFHENIKPSDWVLCSHRCHYHFQLHCGLGASDLILRVMRRDSMFLHGNRFISSAIVAGTCSIATGIALAIQARGGEERVWNFVGDGAEDHGHFAEAVRFVHGRKLPCTFIIEDNNSSCGVTKEQRGSPDDWKWPDCVIRYRYTPKWPHAGTGNRPNLKWTPKNP